MLASAAVHMPQDLGANMAESYPLAVPTNRGAAQIEITQTDVVAATASPFTGSTQVVRRQGQWWGLNVTLPPMDRTDARQWRSMLLRLRGKFGTFLIGDPDAATPAGTAASAPGTPLVKGASQTGSYLVIDGAPAGSAGYLLSGDYIQLGSGASSRLHLVLEDAPSDGSGNVTLNLWPDLRTSPADNAAVVVSSAKGHFRRADNVLPVSIDDMSIYGLTFSAIEAL
jgi:hypothetical protein